MQNELNSTDQYDDEIDLRELFSVLWGGKKLIVGITAVFALVAVFHALSIPNQYRATALVSPAQGSGGGLSGALGQLGGLASLAGVSIGGGESSEAQVAQEIMRSRGFIEEFISENNLDVEVFAAQGWDRGSNQLEINSDLYDVDSSLWLRDAPAGKTVQPTGWALYKRFSGMFSVSEDKKTGMISISVEYFSPKIAKQWVDQLIIGINQHMQSRKLDQVNINIQYLEAQIQKTSIAEMREVFYTIIEEQIKSKMLAEASPEYAFVTVSPAMVPEEKSQPKRALICILGTLLGGMLSVLWVLVMHYTRATTTAVGQ
ncbi:Wzz/FepE/Etk N-terminal domain-containing protein [Porticoccaceae bacterium]|nr:Wzz/FepE/Etk N-terminal domain-containing protein [Porticoccaceae bacterium]